MKIKHLFSTALLLTVFISAGVMSAEAQAKTCGLNLEVTEKIYAEPPIQGATATAVNLKTKKIFKAVLFEGMPVFGDLAAGKYTVTVSKKGYQTLVRQITLDCSNLEDDDQSKTEYFLLRKIKPKRR
jgi:hypothetical protein